MEHTYGAHFKELRIRPVLLEDLELLRSWRNDASISRYLRKISYINTQQQLEWYQKSLSQHDSYSWSILDNNKVIGSLSIYDIFCDRADFGRFMIGDNFSHGKGYGYKALIMTMKIGFQLLNLKSYKLTVHEKNVAALRIYKKAGFRVVNSYPCNGDENSLELEMTINKQTYEETNPEFNDVAIYTDWKQDSEEKLQ